MHPMNQLWGCSLERASGVGVGVLDERGFEETRKACGLVGPLSRVKRGPGTFKGWAARRDSAEV